MRILVRHDHTLHAKVTIPVAARLADRGHEVTYAARGPRWRRFSPRYVRVHPTSVAILDRAALRYVARLIGYEEDWRRVEASVSLAREPADASFDAVVASTKDLEQLERVRREAGVPVFALGYQHMPYLMGDRVAAAPSRDGSPFLERNPFTDAHGFLELLSGWEARPLSFTYLDRVRERRPAGQRPERTALLFHPGGYRRVVSDPGDSKAVCYAKQQAFLERACLPLVAAGLKPIVKIHPLRARYHDLGDVTRIARGIEREHGLATGTIGCLGPDAWYWDDAFRASVVLNYGSSSLYELWSAGVDRAIVCNFEGRARSEKFTLFPSIVLSSHEAYRRFVAERRYDELELDPLARRVASGYAALCDGRATEEACAAIEAAA